MEQEKISSKNSERVTYDFSKLDKWYNEPLEGQIDIFEYLASKDCDSQQCDCNKTVETP